MRHFNLASVVFVTAALSAAPVLAKNVSIPKKNPVAMFSIPDSWEITETDYGYQATSEDESVYVSIEVGGEKDANDMVKETTTFLVKQGVKVTVKKKDEDFKFKGNTCIFMGLEGEDKEGPTQVTHLLCPAAGGSKMVHAVQWASEKAQQKYEKDLDSILDSLSIIK